MDEMLEKLLNLRRDCSRIIQGNNQRNRFNCTETAKLALHIDYAVSDFEKYWSKLLDYLVEETDVQQCENCGEWCQAKLCDDCKPSICYRCHGSGCCPEGPPPDDFGQHKPCRTCEGKGTR
jgi:DnaJ-class molecular chaperone